MVEMQNGIAILENILPVSYKIKHTVTIWSSNPNPRCLPKSNENICLHKSLYVNVYNSFIHNCQNLNTNIFHW